MTEIKQSIIIRYAEIGTKGKNRPDFEKQLVNNLYFFLKKNNIDYSAITYPHGRIYIHFNNLLLDGNGKTAKLKLEAKDKLNCIKNIFGISSYSFAIKIPYTIENIKEIITAYFKEEITAAKSFRISTQKLDTMALSSIEIDRLIGEYVYENYNQKVSLKNPELEIGIEIYQKYAYLFIQKSIAFSGLPVGSEGTILIIVKDKRSVLAALLLLKRGCRIIIAGKNDVYQKYQQLLDSYIPYNYTFYPLTEQEINRGQEELAKQHHALAYTTGAFYKKQSSTELLNPIALLDDGEVDQEIINFQRDNQW